MHQKGVLPMTKDLTVGNPRKVLWSFCLPMFGSIIFQQLYNIADSLVAGKFVDENALAAVGNSYQITLIFIAFAFGCNIGCSVIVARLFGAKDYQNMKTAVYTTFISSAVLCAVLMLAGLIFFDPLLRLIKTPDDLMESSTIYMNIYIYGLPFLFFYNIATGIFSALGDSKTPFIFLAFSSVANILVDILFVTAFDMGIAGVAWATFLCQGVSCVAAIALILKRLARIHCERKAALFSFTLFKEVSVIAVPSILQQSFISLGNILIQGVINNCGIGVIAGYSAAVKLNNLVITSFTTLANGVSNFTAQNLGAGKPERIRMGFRAGIRLVWILCVPLVLLYVVFGRYLLLLFMDHDSAQALKTGMEFLCILSPFFFVVSAKLIADGILRGVGAMPLFMTATFTDLLLRVILAFAFSPIWGSTGIWCAWPVGWSIATVMSLCFYRLTTRRLTAKFSRQ